MEKYAVVIILEFILICIFFSLFITCYVRKDILKNEAIEKGHAQYNKTTGQWEWK